ncbi:MAG: tetratricopeptide repeat protein [Hyphomicrobiales bacterium]|nr:tetratricopeptide repeat protein [Hyphomicrobiales bacterium]
MADIFREVDEEVRQDKALALWEKYQTLIVAVALAIVVAAGGWRFWQWRQLQAQEASGARYQAAMALSREGKVAESEAALHALSKDGAKGYAELASMRAAAELGASDPAAGAKAYDALAANAALDPVFRDVARLRAAILLSDKADRAEIDNRLTPLAQSGQPFRSSARELLALAALKANDYAAAGRWLDEIVSDPEAAPVVKQRAEAFLALVRSNMPAPAAAPK